MGPEAVNFHFEDFFTNITSALSRKENEKKRKKNWLPTFGQSK